MAAVPHDHEQGLADRGLRKGLGAYYTPADVVEGLLDLTLAPILSARVADGAGGGGDPRARSGVRHGQLPRGRGPADRDGARRELGLDPAASAAAAVRCVRGSRSTAAPPRCAGQPPAVDPTASGRQVKRGDALPRRRSGP